MHRIQKKVRFEPDEVARIDANLSQAGAPSFQFYAHQMILHGAIIHVTFEEISTLNFELNRIGNNFNQLVKKLHQIGNFHAVEAEETREIFLKMMERIAKAEKQLIKQIEREVKHGLR